jgi:predicted RNase H-like HicB family nuclease
MGNSGVLPMKSIKIIVEKHPDGYITYPLGIKGVVVGQGDSYEEALADVKSAIRFHIESFGESMLAS